MLRHLKELSSLAEAELRMQYGERLGLGEVLLALSCLEGTMKGFQRSVLVRLT